MPTYNPLIPSGTVNLDEDYKNIRDNFNQANVVIGVDHVPFDDTTAQKGYHKDIHLNPFSTTVTNPATNYVTADQFPSQGGIPPGAPPTVTGIGQLFSSSVNDAASTDTGLYWLSGGGLKVAMTRNFQPLAAANGYTFLPGGLILQWGVQTVAVNAWTTGTVTFATANKAFPNACFGVFKMFKGVAGASTSSGDMYITALSATSFTWNFTTSANANFNGFYWAAIGY
jgi:hypothetical protein